MTLADTDTPEGEPSGDSQFLNPAALVRRERPVAEGHEVDRRRQ